MTKTQQDLQRWHHVLEYSRAGVRGNVIEGVKIIGTRSAHGWTYPPAVLEEAIPLYESSPVFISHPDAREKRQGSRQLRDHLGNLENVSGNGDGLFGDLSVRLSHPLAGQILEEATRSASFGLSHNAQVELNADQTEVTSIAEVNSVDLVDDPATTQNLFEENAVAQNKEERSVLQIVQESKSLDELVGTLKKLLAQLESNDAGTRPTRRLTALEDRRDDEGDPPKTGNTHDDFMGALRGFSLK